MAVRSGSSTVAESSGKPEACILTSIVQNLLITGNYALASNLYGTLIALGAKLDSRSTEPFWEGRGKEGQRPWLGVCAVCMCAVCCVRPISSELGVL